MSDHKIRLQKYIADCGITSRRKAEDLILANQVKVNGKTVNKLGTKVDPELDSVMVNGTIIDVQAVDHVYLVMNKPRGYVTTVSDPEGRRTVMDLIPIKTRVFPVGRLDYLSEGLLLFTNDGELANTIMHPRYEVEKTYEVKVFGKVGETLLKKLRAGVMTSHGLMKPTGVRIIEQLPQKTWLEFRLSEGKNREIRRICEGCNVTIDKLRRVAIGALSINGIPVGQWEYIAKKELLGLIGLNKNADQVLKKMQYQSPKKTVNVHKGLKIQKKAKSADDYSLQRYNKESYYDTLKLQREAAAQRALLGK